MKFYLEIEKPSEKYCDGCRFLNGVFVSVTDKVMEQKEICSHTGNCLERDEKLSIITPSTCPLKTIYEPDGTASHIKSLNHSDHNSYLTGSKLL
jgi:hypothetical protein